MCLAVPGQILSVAGDEPLSRTGRVSFGGVVKEVNLALVPEAGVGDYVLVHVGVAISKVDETEARQVFEYLRQMEEMAELEPGPSGGSESGLSETVG
jgi:hydrogenase expression/formation protein HypC